jgi:methyltransferase (TIGR00027 family)
MHEDEILKPEATAARVSLWRAMHVEVDPPPHVFEDTVGLELIAPPDDWRQRPDMGVAGTAGYRAGVVGRARFVEDLVLQQANLGVSQFVLLGAGLDTFAQRRRDIASRMRVFEVDLPGPQLWKRRRLIELGYGMPEWLHLVPVDFERGQSWWSELLAAGFDVSKPAIVASTGVSMYLERDANIALLQQLAQLAPGSTLAMTFLLPLELIDASERAQHQQLHERARAAGTPFLSFFKPEEMLALAKDAGFRAASHVSTFDLTQRYFAGRADGLKPAFGESFVVASTGA